VHIKWQHERAQGIINSSAVKMSMNTANLWIVVRPVYASVKFAMESSTSKIPLKSKHLATSSGSIVLSNSKSLSIISRTFLVFAIMMGTTIIKTRREAIKYGISDIPYVQMAIKKQMPNRQRIVVQKATPQCLTTASIFFSLSSIEKSFAAFYLVKEPELSHSKDQAGASR